MIKIQKHKDSLAIDAPITPTTATTHLTVFVPEFPHRKSCESFISSNF